MGGETANTERYEGRCLCGGVRVAVTGPPLAAGYCHCESCRRWHAAPFNAWAIWPADRFEMLDGEQLLVEHDSRPSGGNSIRCRCSRCGAGVINRKPDGRTIVYAMTLGGSGFRFSPSCHIHCRERVIEVSDGLPKYADLPARWGGSGTRIDDRSQERR